MHAYVYPSSYICIHTYIHHTSKSIHTSMHINIQYRTHIFIHRSYKSSSPSVHGLTRAMRIFIYIYQGNQYASVHPLMHRPIDHQDMHKTYTHTMPHRFIHPRLATPLCSSQPAHASGLRVVLLRGETTTLGKLTPKIPYSSFKQTLSGLLEIKLNKIKAYKSSDTIGQTITFRPFFKQIRSSRKWF
jgi:hypothetical protein